MNEKDFKRHLRDLVHGHHHPEEHDWGTQPAAPRKPAPARKARARKAGRTSKSAK